MVRVRKINLRLKLRHLKLDEKKKFINKSIYFEYSAPYIFKYNSVFEKA